MILFITFLFGQEIMAAPAIAVQKRCDDLLFRIVTRDHFVAPIEIITNLHDLGKAMTYGMLLSAKDGDLFEIYRYGFLGDPTTNVDQRDLAAIYDIVRKNSMIKKSPMREMEITTTTNIIERPKKLLDLIQGQIKTSVKARAELFHIDANIGSWIKATEVETKEDLIKIIPLELRAMLTDDKTHYHQKIIALYTALKKIIDSNPQKKLTHLKEKMALLVGLSALNNKSVLDLLHSSFIEDNLIGLKRMIKEREDLAAELKIAKGYQMLLAEGPAITSSIIKKESVEEFERMQQQMVATAMPKETIRVRTLSLQESPFRSCLGKDCSTRKYFEKALDPNYYYYTLTDKEFHSTGQATVVLGTGENNIKFAFLDKLQNIPADLIIPFLFSMKRSLAESGYQLVIPVDLSGENGLSISDMIRNFVQANILPRLKNRVAGFKPHHNSYAFPNEYSRADENLELALFDMEWPAGTHYEINDGARYNTYYNAMIDLPKMAADFLALKNSVQEHDLIAYINNDRLMMSLDKVRLYSMISYYKDLENLLSDTTRPLKIRKLALYKLVTRRLDDSRHQLVKYLQYYNLSESDIRQIGSEIRQWNQSNESIKREIITKLNKEYLEAVELKNEGIIKLFKGLYLVAP